jgi:hypothetical protein
MIPASLLIQTPGSCLTAYIDSQDKKQISTLTFWFEK